MTKAYQIIRDVEIELDRLNGELGSKDDLCLFCNTKAYDGVKGLLHDRDCLISRLRDFLKGSHV